MSNGSLWDSVLENAPEEQAPMVDLPINKFFLMETCTAADGASAPQTREFNVTRGENAGTILRKFNVGMRCIGAETSLEEKAVVKRMLFFEAFLYPGEREGKDKLLSGRLTGFLNACFAPGTGDDILEDIKANKITGDAKKAKMTERTNARWAVTVNKLRAAADTFHLDVDEYEGDVTRFLTACAVTALCEEKCTVVVKSGGGTYKDKTTGEKKPKRVEASQIHDYTPAVLKLRGVVEFDAEGSLTSAVPAVAKEGPAF